jgi:hypothetical protein
VYQSTSLDGVAFDPFSFLRAPDDRALATAQLGDAGLATQALQHNADWSSAEKWRRVARRMLFKTCAAGSFTGPDFCLIFAP